MSQAHILVVDDDKIIAKTLAILLKRLGYTATTINSPVEALRWLQLPGNYPDLIISDVSMPELSGYEFVSQVRAAPVTAHVPIIMLTAHGEIDNKVEGFKAGADDYLVKPVDRAELEWRIKALLSRSQKTIAKEKKAEAKIISIFSLRGGSGKTSIAVNLSLALAQLWQKQIALLDLALTSGHCALMLNLNPKYSLTDLVGWDDSTIEADNVEKLLLVHNSSSVRLLAAPSLPTEAELITPAVIDRVWPYLRATFPFVVIDAGSQFVEPVLTMLERSHHILLPLSPELGSIKAAVDAIEVFEQIGYDRERILPVINATFPGGGIPQSHIENTLKLEIAASIPFARNEFVQAINTGQPHFKHNAGSAASRAIATLAYKLSPDEMDQDQAMAPSQLLTWVRKLVLA